MSDRDPRPEAYICGGSGQSGPEELLITSRRVYLGKTTEVARALPDRVIRMVGAWCFLDHYGPEDVARSAGMQVWAHPHTGLQTVTWLIEGEVEHRDSVGSLATVRPGELNIMTAGRGIVHTELSRPDHPPMLHGVQLWVALPDAARFTEPSFASYDDLPHISGDRWRGTVLLGELAGVTSPARTFSPLCGADLEAEPGADVRLQLRPDYEYALFVVEGSLTAGGTTAVVDQLLYLGCGRRAMELATATGVRALLLGGEPFAEELVMWWNFVGRSHQEIVDARRAWESRADQFPPVVAPGERVMEAPPMPTVPLRPRPRRQAAR